MSALKFVENIDSDPSCLGKNFFGKTLLGATNPDIPYKLTKPKEERFVVAEDGSRATRRKEPRPSITGSIASRSKSSCGKSWNSHMTHMLHITQPNHSYHLWLQSYELYIFSIWSSCLLGYRALHLGKEMGNSDVKQ